MTSATVGDVLSLFGEVVTNDPISALLFVVGNVLLLFSIGLFGGLTVWGLVSALRPP